MGAGAALRGRPLTFPPPLGTLYLFLQVQATEQWQSSLSPGSSAWQSPNRLAGCRGFHFMHQTLFDNHKRIAFKLARVFSIPGYDQEDLNQIALMALWQAAMGFDPEYGARFSSYAYKVIHNALTVEYRTYRLGGGVKCSGSQTWEHFQQHTSVKDVWFNFAGDSELIDSSEDDFELESLINSLDWNHQIVLESLLARSRKIAYSQGISPKHFDKVLRSLRQNPAILEFTGKS